MSDYLMEFKTNKVYMEIYAPQDLPEEGVI